MQLNHTSRAVLVMAMAAAGVATMAVPSSAAISPAFFDAEINLAKPLYPVASHCELVAGVTTDVRFVNYVVHATADAAGASVALATSVQCTVYDASDKTRLYGGASGSLVGPHAEAVGQATVPVGRVPAVCVKGGATYLDGTTSASPKVCP